MPSKSKAQQRLMGAAYAAKKNKTPLKELSPELRNIVKSMDKKQLREFAKTKHEDLPEQKKSASIFKAFVKGAMCNNKSCGSSKMDNKNDDCEVKDKKVQDAEKQVKIVESLGGTKPVKANKKSTALNLKQYALKKKASKKQLIAAVLTGAPIAGLVGYNAMNAKKQEQARLEAIKEQDAQQQQELAEEMQAMEEWNNRSDLEKLNDKIQTIYAQNKQGINAAGAGLGTYGLTRLLGGNRILSGLLGLGASGATYAAQDQDVRKAVKDWWNAFSKIRTKEFGQASKLHPINTLADRLSGKAKNSLIDLGGYLAGNNYLKNMTKVLATPYSPIVKIDGKKI